MSTSVSLSCLLREGRPGALPVAVTRAGERGFEDFRVHVDGLRGRIREHGRGRWLLYSEDSYAFAVAFFALAHAGASALLPSNRQPGTLRRLATEVTGALLDPGVGSGEIPALPVLHPLEATGPDGAPFGTLPRDEPLVELSTSGTTGEGKPVGKALRHLEDEVRVQEARFGARIGREALTFATVSHQHIYGLLFRVLWPLASGRPFVAETDLHAEELLPRMQAAGDFVLVSTPAHLSRLRAPGDSLRLRRRCRAVFSSGGPLDAATAEAIERTLGHAPVEVLGSTETGGIAWRRQGAGRADSTWTPLDGVRISLGDGDRLAVTSPFVSTGEPLDDGMQRFVTGDRIRPIAGDRFELLERADRVVKIGEKRLSLPEMESQLRAHRFVADAGLCPFEPGSGPRVGAVVVLAEAGRRALAREGRRALAAVLGDHLAAHWDRVLLPRAWRYVEALPRDAQGKLPLAVLRDLLGEGGARPMLDPVLHAESREGRVLELDLSVPRDLAFLEGHYEAFPLVAGVVQLHWVMRAAERWLEPAPRLRGLEGLKFKEVLLPAQRFRMRLELVEAGDRLRFRLDHGERIFSEGRLLLASRAEPAR